MRSRSDTEDGSGVALAEIIATDELDRRAARPANYRVEAQVMAILAQILADQPHEILRVLVRTAVELCGGGTCGISLLERDGDTAVFRWVALAGPCERYAGGCTPRNHSPCGVTLDRGEPQLYARPSRYFAYLADVDPEIVEGLVIPFFHDEVAFGTIWIVSHDPARRFDSEDVRLMTRLAAFTAAGLQATRSQEQAEQARQALAFLGKMRARAQSDGDGDAVNEIVSWIGEYFSADHCWLVERSSGAREITINATWSRGEPPRSGTWEAVAALCGADCWQETLQNSASAAGGADAGGEPSRVLAALGVACCASTPCIRPQGAGVLFVARRRSVRWNADDISLLEAVAAHLSMAGRQRRG